MNYAVIVILLILSYLLSTDIYTPSMPEIARDFAVPSDDVQKTMSFFLLGSVLACFFSGLLADRFGKKNFLVAGMALAIVASLLTLFSLNIEWLVFARFLQGLGAGVAPVIGFSIIQELYDDEKQTKIFGIIGISIATIPAFAPFLGGLISTHLHWKHNFALLVLMFTICFICVAKILPRSLNDKIPFEDKVIQKNSSIFQSYKEILTSRTFLTLALLSPLYNASEWFCLSFLPFYMQNNIGISADFYGFIIGALILWFGVGSSIGTRLVRYYGTHKTILIGLWLGVLAAILLWFSALFHPLSILGICVPLAIFLAAFGILFPSSVKASLTFFAHTKTRVSSLRSLFITAFAYVGSLSAEWVKDTDLKSLALFISLTSGLSIVVYAVRDRNEAI
ncbi:MAG: multidrug effflux MFS transporter [Alphaproteobacteria bacterium]|nr:multidrug effflux MFS transporter [Alphaproteobacteria bacterium]